MNDEKLRLLDEFLSFREGDWPSYKERSLLQNAVLEVVDAFQVPDEMAIMVALGAMSIACQGSIEVKQPYGGKINTALYTLTIAESGERKTTVSNQLTQGIERVNAELSQRYEKELKSYLRDAYIWGVKNKTLESQYKSAIKKNEDLDEIETLLKDHLMLEPMRPQSPKFIYKDTTPEALLRSMYLSQRDACVIMDEANKIFKSNLTEDLGLLNKLWDSGSVVVDRVSTESFEFKDASLTLLLMTQMIVIQSFLEKRGDSARGSGFLARLLVVRPRKNAGNHQLKSFEKLPSIDAFNDRLYYLIKKRVNASVKEKITLSYTETAKLRWNEEYHRVQQEQKPGGLYELHVDHAAKLMDNLSRIAAIVHWFNHDESTDERYFISDETLDYAIQLCYRFSKHYLYYMAGKPKVIEDVESLVDFCLTFKRKEDFSVNISHSLRSLMSVHKYIQTEVLNQIDIKVRLPVILAFTFADVRQYGPNSLRNNRDAFNNAIHLLERMDVIKQTNLHGSTYYLFNEATHLGHEGESYLPEEYSDSLYNRYLVNKPKLTVDYHSSLQKPKFKNGHLYQIANLPIFEQLVPVAYHATFRHNKNLSMACMYLINDNY